MPGKVNYRSVFMIWIPVLLIPLIYSFRTLDPVLHIRSIALSAILLSLSAYIIFTQTNRSQDNSFKTNAFFILYTVFLIFSLLNVFQARNTGDALFEYSKYILLGSFVIIYTYTFNGTDLWKEASRAVVLVSFIITGIGIYQLAAIDRRLGLSHEQLYFMSSVFGHKNIFMEVLFLSLPFSIYAAATEKIWKSLPGLIASLLAIGLIIVSMTRAVWLSLFISTLLLVVYILTHWKNAQPHLIGNSWHKTLSFTLLTVVTIVVAIFIYSRKDTFLTFSKQADKIANFNYGSAKDRIELWERSIRLVEEKPVIGHGLGDWKTEVLKYGKENLGNEDEITFYQRPHNDFLWIASEQGLVGLALYLGIIIWLYVYIISNLSRARDSNMFYRNFLIFFGFTGYLVFSFFAFPKERIEHILFLGMMISVVIIDFNANSKKNRKNNGIYFKISITLSFCLVFISLLLSLLIGISRYNSETMLKKAFSARSQQEWQREIFYLEEARTFFYSMDPFSTPLDWYVGSARFKLGQIEEARKSFLKAYNLNPYHIHILNNLGTCFEYTGQHEEALAFYEKAIAISPGFGDALFNLAAIYYNIDSTERSAQYLSKIDSLDNPERYAQFKERIVARTISELKIIIQEEEIKVILQGIEASDPWKNSVWWKAVENDHTFKDQLLLDAIYLMEMEDSIINASEATDLKSKYNLNP